MRLDNLSRKLRPLGLIIALGINMALVSATGAWAQNDITRRELGNFHDFLENHPRIAQELRSNPSMINNRRWVDDHNELQAFLRHNPRLREELQANPQRFMAWERRYDPRWGDNVTWRDVRSFEDFLDSHPSMAERLRHNPNLVNDRQFLTNHEDLRDFLRNHPDLSRSLRSNPYAFVERASR